jgi:hypothetical protein
MGSTNQTEGNAALQMMQLLSIKAAKDLGLDMSVTKQK